MGLTLQAQIVDTQPRLQNSPFTRTHCQKVIPYRTHYYNDTVVINATLRLLEMAGDVPMVRGRVCFLVFLWRDLKTILPLTMARLEFLLYFLTDTNLEFHDPYIMLFVLLRTYFVTSKRPSESSTVEDDGPGRSTHSKPSHFAPSIDVCTTAASITKQSTSFPQCTMSF